MLGVTMILLGNEILGNLNKEATSQESLGLAFWRIVISSGIVVIVMGIINIFAVGPSFLLAFFFDGCGPKFLAVFRLTHFVELHLP
jgi:hypothetical protein